MHDAAQPVSPPKTTIHHRLARLQMRHPWVVVALALLLTLGSIPLVRHLGLNSDWSALLPKSKPSVKDLKRVAGRVGGLNTLTMVVESKDTDAIIAFTKDLVPKLKALQAPEILSIDWTVGTFEAFARKYQYLYVPLSDLEEVRDALEDRITYEKAKANPFFIPLDDPPDDPETVIRRLQEKAAKKGNNSNRRPGPYYMDADGHLLAIFIRTDVAGGDVKAGRALIAKVNGAVAATGPSKYAKDLTVKYTGELITSREEHDAIATELVIATIVTAVLVLGSILVLFWRFRSLLLLGLGIAVPTTMTFAFAKLSVHELNSSTAFLASIVIGNGINPGIVWLARYFEERRAKVDREEALTRTYAGTLPGTLSAAVAASLSYGSLIIADFRGFRDFGIIASVGMLICWLSMMTLLPALAVITERVKPLTWKTERSEGTFYGRIVWRAIAGAPRIVVGIFTILAVVSAGFIWVAVIKDPLEYDFRHLRSVRETSTDASRLNGLVGKVVGKAATGSAIAVLMDRQEDVAPFKAQLEAQRQKGYVPYGKIRTINDLLPKDQKAKLPIIAEVRNLLLDARKFANPEQQKRIDANTPPEHVRPLTMADLPEEVARPYAERDGTRGRIVFVESQSGKSVWDGRYLIAWAGAIRKASLPDGSKPALAGRAPIFADMIAVVVEDGPKAVLASFIMTLVLVMMTFRRMRDRLYTLGSLLVGVLLMLGGMAVLQMKVNFLNFVAFPITFGISVEYAVNTLRRYVEERDGGIKSRTESIRAAVAETGGAVILCSLTTVFGYISLFTSANKALNSFGAAMTIAELTCLSTAVVGIPAFILMLARRDGEGAAPKAP